MTEYDFMSMLTPPPEGAICDFCSAPDVHWSYPCRDHQGTEHAAAVGLERDGSLAVHKMSIEHFSRGGWTACNACHALIERGDRDRLARRSAKRLIRAMGLGAAWSLSDATEHVRRLHDAFWANREGAPVRHDQRPTEDPTR